MAIRSFDLVVFSHGKESGPWGTKITAMAAAAQDLGVLVESIDYRGMDDPALRVAKLIGRLAELPRRAVLVGSSMGGHVAAAAAGRIGARGLFLLAPAFYMAGFEAQTPQTVDCPAMVVHGWRDDVVPVANGIRWARERRAALHVFDSDHRLEDRIAQICALLCGFLNALG